MPSQELLNIIIKATDEASATAEKVDNSLKRIGENTKSLGNTTVFDSMKTKLSTVATSIDSKFGGALTKARTKFSTLKNTVSNVASSIKGKFGGAIDGVRSKLTGLGNGAKNVSSSFGFLKGAASMTAGMIGFELVSSLVETTRASLNARSSMQAFAGRLKMSSQEVDAFQQSLDEMQNSYKKIDMDVVGQQATDMAYRLGLPKTSLTELTETTAIFTDAMQRNGRSAEDSMLAMSDAMDGQFVRLKEIGIGQDDLMKNGWSGDINDKTGLLHAMNQALKEQHYDDLAKSVDTLDDAWQVLSITMSNLLEKILVPLTPVIVGVVEGFTNAMDAVKPFVDTLLNSAGALPEWLQDAGWATALGLGLYYVGTVIMSTVVPALAAAALAAMDFAIAMLMNPWTYVLVALVAIAYAIYEVGKSFGWWTDVGSMLEAIWAGIQRLWSAFINHPGVQEAIDAISNAVGVLWGWIQQAGQAILDFFGVSSEGDFDVVRAIIDTVGAAWDALSIAIGAVINVVTTVWNTISWVVGQIWAVVGPFVMQIIGFFTNIGTAIDNFKNGQLDLPGFIISVLTNLANAYLTFLNMIITTVVTFATRIWNWATKAGSGFVNNIMKFLKSLPGKAYNALMGVVGRISSAIQSWINTAKGKVSSLISNVINQLTSLPGKVASAVSGVAGALAKPFTDAWNNYIKPVVDNINNAIKTVGDALSWGGEPAYGGETINDSEGNAFNISNGQYIVESNEPIVIEDNVNLTLDLANVPANMSVDDLASMIQDRRVLQALTSNRDFQDLDAKVKQKITLKGVRARGR